jgi:hypothetical protein
MLLLIFWIAVTKRAERKHFNGRCSEGDWQHASKGNEQCVRHLLDYRALPNARGMHNTSVENGAEDIIHYGGDVNGSLKDGTTPLNKAVCDGNIQMIELLLEQGADIEKLDSNGWTAKNCSWAISCPEKENTAAKLLLLPRSMKEFLEIKLSQGPCLLENVVFCISGLPTKKA